MNIIYLGFALASLGEEYFWLTSHDMPEVGRMRCDAVMG